MQQQPTMKVGRLQISSLAGTVVLGLITLVVAGISWQLSWAFWMALSFGALGGLVHEFAQSKGTILFAQWKADGLYLGASTGILLGAVAGMLIAEGTLADSTIAYNKTALAFKIFSAGLALKGLAEAATTK